MPRKGTTLQSQPFLARKVTLRDAISALIGYFCLIRFRDRAIGLLVELMRVANSRLMIWRVWHYSCLFRS